MSIIKAQGSGEVSTGFYPYSIGQSLRFNDGDSSYLKRTPSSQGSLTTFTYSFWYKRCVFGTYQEVLHVYPGSGERSQILFMNNDTLKVELEAGNTNHFLTNMLFRDPSAWYHVVVTFDSTNGTQANRVKIYVNGVDQSGTGGGGFSTANYPSQNATSGFNTTTQHEISTYDGSDYHLDGYLAEVNFVDSAALTAASFGETKDGIWIPKSSSGLTFGTNGFYLPFDDSSAIGDDESGNTNDWTVVNLVASDVVPDSPTNNFATLNLLAANQTATVSEGNLKLVTPNSGYGMRFSTFQVPTSGKWYWEALMVANSSGAKGILGVSAYDAAGTYFLVEGSRVGLGYYQESGVLYGNQDTSGTSYGASYAAGDIISVAVNVDDDEVTFYKNNSTQGTDSFDAAGLFALFGDYSNSYGCTWTVNFGQDSTFAGGTTAGGNSDSGGIGDFKYAPPSGFLALCSQNLPDVDIIDGTEHFNTVLYTGNASTNAITGVNFSPDWVWVKNRASAYDHRVYDSVRGVEKTLYPSGNYYENEGGDGATGLTAFGTDGFTLGNHVGANKSGDAYVAWNWLAGTAFSNDASATGVGTIDSEGQVNTKAGFSIVKYTGNNTNNATVAHGLSSTPEMIIARSRGEAENWVVYHKDITPASNSLSLNLNIAPTAFGSGWVDNATSTVFRLKDGTSGTDTRDNVNKASTDYIAYCFHSVEGYSKVGSYIGGGSTFPFVFTGFRPAWIMVKKTSGAEAWWIVDSVRETANPLKYGLQANSSAAELSVSKPLDFLSNGFKPRVSTGYHNDSGATYVYLAFAKQPFKFANAR